MRNVRTILAAGVLGTLLIAGSVNAQTYKPTKENLEVRKQFASERFGIFLHWGIYSTYAQGEWYLNTDKLNKDEYSQAAGGFFPSKFNAKEWVKAFKDAGAKYICLTSRHHDGFSMFKTNASKFNIVDDTPFGRDVVGELSKACEEEGMSFQLYYSLLDWTREDYPLGNSGHFTGRKGNEQNYDHYFKFMEAQIKELLTNYSNVRALWFDGFWDQPKNFDWRIRELYDYIHSIKPSCLVGNNHHEATIDGEDFQMFEKDLPGQNKTGFSKESVVSEQLPLEMCETMNDMWGYKVADLNYKSVPDLIHLLVKSAALGSNLLLNIGPRPNGELPDLALDRLKGMGKWMREFGNTVYGTTAGDVPEQPWGVSTRKDNKLFLHVFKLNGTALQVPMEQKVKKAVVYGTTKALRVMVDKPDKVVTISLPEKPSGIDYIVELTL